MTDYDSPWKEALELYFEAFLALFYPKIHADIDWSRGFSFLDKELQKIMPMQAHLKALETRDNPQSRRTWKLRLVRGLYERVFSGEDVRQLFRIIDWLMELPPELDDQVDEEIEKFSEGPRMPYVTSTERRGMFLMIKSLLLAKFGDDAADLLDPIRDLNEAEKFEKMIKVVAAATTLDGVRRAYRRIAAPPRKRNGKGKRAEAP